MPGREAADEYDRFLLAAFFKRARRTNRTLRSEGQDAFEIRIGPDLVLRGLEAFIDAFGNAETVAEHLHLRIFLFLIGDRRVGPGIVQWHGEGSDIDDVFAFLAHILGEQIHMRVAVAFGRGELEIPVHFLLVGTFMRQDLDAGGTGATEHRFEGG